MVVITEIVDADDNDQVEAIGPIEIVNEVVEVEPYVLLFTLPSDMMVEVLVRLSDNCLLTLRLLPDLTDMVYDIVSSRRFLDRHLRSCDVKYIVEGDTEDGLLHRLYEIDDINFIFIREISNNDYLVYNACHGETLVESANHSTRGALYGFNIWNGLFRYFHGYVAGESLELVYVYDSRSNGYYVVRIYADLESDFIIPFEIFDMDKRRWFKGETVKNYKPFGPAITFDGYVLIQAELKDNIDGLITLLKFNPTNVMCFASITPIENKWFTTLGVIGDRLSINLHNFNTNQLEVWVADSWDDDWSRMLFFTLPDDDWNVIIDGETKVWMLPNHLCLFDTAGDNYMFINIATQQSIVGNLEGIQGSIFSVVNNCRLMLEHRHQI